MKFFVRAAVVAGLMSLDVPRHKIDDCWSRWVAENVAVPLDNVSALEFYDSVVSAAKAAGK